MGAVQRAMSWLGDGAVAFSADKISDHAHRVLMNPKIIGILRQCGGVLSSHAVALLVILFYLIVISISIVRNLLATPALGHDFVAEDLSGAVWHYTRMSWILFLNITIPFVLVSIPFGLILAGVLTFLHVLVRMHPAFAFTGGTEPKADVKETPAEVMIQCHLKDSAEKLWLKVDKERGVQAKMLRGLMSLKEGYQLVAAPLPKDLNQKQESFHFRLEPNLDGDKKVGAVGIRARVTGGSLCCIFDAVPWADWDVPRWVSVLPKRMSSFICADQNEENRGVYAGTVVAWKGHLMNYVQEGKRGFGAVGSEEKFEKIRCEQNLPNARPSPASNVMASTKEKETIAPPAEKETFLLHHPEKQAYVRLAKRCAEDDFYFAIAVTDKALATPCSFEPREE